MYVFLEGYGTERTPFEMSETRQTSVHLRYVVENEDVEGFPINGLLGEMTESERVEGTLMETAETWYERAYACI